MTAGVLTILTFISIILFPWGVSVLLALAAGSRDPLVPLAAGIFADLLYYSPSVAAFPYSTLLGIVAATGLFFVRSRLRTGIMKE